MGLTRCYKLEVDDQSVYVCLMCSVLWCQLPRWCIILIHQLRETASLWQQICLPISTNAQSR